MEQPSLGPHQSFRGINAANLCMEKLFALCHSRGGRPRNVAFNDEKRVGNAPAPVIEAVLPKQSRISVRISRIPRSSSEKAVLVPFRTKFDHSSNNRENNLPLSPHCRNFSTMGAANSAIKTFVHIELYHDVPTTLLGVFSPPSQVKTYTVTSDR